VIGFIEWENATSDKFSFEDFLLVDSSEEARKGIFVKGRGFINSIIISFSLSAMQWII